MEIRVPQSGWINPPLDTWAESAVAKCWRCGKCQGFQMFAGCRGSLFAADYARIAPVCGSIIRRGRGLTLDRF
jgi:hypothetical protein